jgi:hypothetical protein
LQRMSLAHPALTLAGAGHVARRTCATSWDPTVYGGRGDTKDTEIAAVSAVVCEALECVIKR